MLASVFIDVGLTLTSYFNQLLEIVHANVSDWSKLFDDSNSRSLDGIEFDLTGYLHV